MRVTTDISFEWCLPIYLGGPIAGCSDAETHGWREQMKHELRGFTCIDPTDRDYRGREAENVAAIVEGDKADIDRCLVMLMNCPRPSAGTSMEIFYGWSTGKRVVVVAPEPVSPWVRYHSHALFSTLAEAVEALNAVLPSAMK